mmetsp:Transcript_15459/g.33492  ORF Transcript_15459/g.33492 Transcript_15459/m.33492 type:complete len:260 (-) Transcript_15459:93-872(-)
MREATPSGDVGHITSSTKVNFAPVRKSGLIDSGAEAAPRCHMLHTTLAAANHGEMCRASEKRGTADSLRRNITLAVSPESKFPVLVVLLSQQHSFGSLLLLKEPLPLSTWYHETGPFHFVGRDGHIPELGGGAAALLDAVRLQELQDGVCHGSRHLVFSCETRKTFFELRHHNEAFLRFFTIWSFNLKVHAVCSLHRVKAIWPCFAEAGSSVATALCKWVEPPTPRFHVAVFCCNNVVSDHGCCCVSVTVPTGTDRRGG